MCEHCRQVRKTRVEKLLPERVEEWPVPCDFCRKEILEDRTSAGCSNPREAGRDSATLTEPAEWVMRKLEVEGHYCQRHAEELMAMMAGKLGDLFRTAGFQEGEDYLPITEPEKCDYVTLQDGAEKGLPQCAGQAAFARVSITPLFVCKKHAAPYLEG